MKIIYQNFLIFFSLIVLGGSVIGQNYIAIDGDTTFIWRDSLYLVVNSFKGQIFWQSSNNSIDWYNLEENNDSLLVTFDSTAYYRGEIIKSNCAAVYTKTFLSGIKIIKSDEKVNSLDSKGGFFELYDHTILKIPENVCATPAEITYDTLDESQMATLINCPCLSDSIVLVHGFELQSSKPILIPLKVEIPVSDFTSVDLPVLYKFDDLLKLWIRIESDFLCNIATGKIEIQQLGSGKYILALHKNAMAFEETSLPLKSVGVQSVNGQPEKVKDCKEGKIYVQSEEIDYTIQEGVSEKKCFVNSSKVEVTYLDCKDSPREHVSIKEIGEGCKPKLYIESDKKILKKGETANLTVRSTIGNRALRSQQIDCETISGLKITSNAQKTNSEGIIIFTIEATEADITAEISVILKYNYSLSVTDASGNGESVTVSSGNRTGSISEKLTIQTFDICTKPENIKCELSDINECNEVKKILIDHLQLEPEKSEVFYTETIKIECKGFNYLGEEISNLPDEIIWESSDETKAIVDEEGYITGVGNEGYVTISARICEDIIGEESIYVKPNIETWEMTVSCVFNNLAIGVSYELASYNEVYSMTITWYAAPGSGVATGITGNGTANEASYWVSYDSKVFLENQIPLPQSHTISISGSIENADDRSVILTEIYSDEDAIASTNSCTLDDEGNKQCEFISQPAWLYSSYDDFCTIPKTGSVNNCSGINSTCTCSGTRISP